MYYDDYKPKKKNSFITFILLLLIVDIFFPKISPLRYFFYTTPIRPVHISENEISSEIPIIKDADGNEINLRDYMELKMYTNQYRCIEGSWYRLHPKNPFYVSCVTNDNIECHSENCTEDDLVDWKEKSYITKICDKSNKNICTKLMQIWANEVKAEAERLKAQRQQQMKEAPICHAIGGGENPSCIAYEEKQWEFLQNNLKSIPDRSKIINPPGVAFKLLDGAVGFVTDPVGVFTEIGDTVVDIVTNPEEYFSNLQKQTLNTINHHIDQIDQFFKDPQGELTDTFDDVLSSIENTSREVRTFVEDTWKWLTKPKNTGGCIGSETILDTNRGKIKLKELKIGDKVLSYKKETNTILYSTVYYIAEHSNIPRKHYKITLSNGDCINLSKEHLLILSDNKYIQTENAMIGYKIKNVYNQIVSIINIEKIQDIPLTPVVLCGNIILPNKTIISCWSHDEKNAIECNKLCDLVSQHIHKYTLEQISDIIENGYNLFKLKNKNRDKMMNEIVLPIPVYVQ